MVKEEAYPRACIIDPLHFPLLATLIKLRARHVVSRHCDYLHLCLQSTSAPTL